MQYIESVSGNVGSGAAGCMPIYYFLGSSGVREDCCAQKLCRTCNNETSLRNKQKKTLTQYLAGDEHIS